MQFTSKIYNSQLAWPNNTVPKHIKQKPREHQGIIGETTIIVGGFNMPPSAADRSRRQSQWRYKGYKHNLQAWCNRTQKLQNRLHFFQAHTEYMQKMTISGPKTKF